MRVSKRVNVRIQQTSDNEPHPGSMKRDVSHIAGTVDALIGKSCILHSQHSSVIDHVVPVSHVIVVSYTEDIKSHTLKPYFPACRKVLPLSWFVKILQQKPVRQ